MWWIGVVALKPHGFFNLNKMKKYNGYRSWNEWNVSLWINNDHTLYCYSLDLINRFTLNIATEVFMTDIGSKTPDGAVYNRLCVYNALKDLKNG